MDATSSIDCQNRASNWGDAMSDKVWDTERLRVATEAGGIALWSWNVDTDRITMDERAFEIWGIPQKSDITFEELSARIHPPDLEMVREAFSSTRDIRGAWEIDFRILHGNQVRWVSARGRGDDQGIVDRIMYGVFLDVTFRKTAEEDRELIAREMNHRIKNLFSLASALASIASRSTVTKEAMFEDLTRRLRGLAAAHDLILAGTNDQRHAVVLEDLLKVLLQAYSFKNSSTENVSISAPEVMVGERSMTSIAMLIHELATNSAKYGALSADTGRLVLVCHEEGDEVKLVWNESGGPPPLEEARHTGFGSVMTDRVIKQIDGSITRNWTDQGLIVTLRMNKALLGV